MLVITDWSFPRRQPIRATSFLFQPYRCSNERDMSASVGSGSERSGTLAISSTFLPWIVHGVNALHRRFAPNAEYGRFFSRPLWVLLPVGIPFFRLLPPRHDLIAGVHRGFHRTGCPVNHPVRQLGRSAQTSRDRWVVEETQRFLRWSTRSRC